MAPEGVLLEFFAEDGFVGAAELEQGKRFR